MVSLELEGVRDDLDRPVAELGTLTGFEAEEKVSRVLGIDAESIHAPFGICFGVCGQPLLYSQVSMRRDQLQGKHKPV